MSEVVLKDIKKVYENGYVGTHDVNISIADKEFIVLVGPSGCGKSTTLRMVAGLEDITDGELYIDGKLMNDVAPKDRDIAMVFQSYALYPQMTVYQNMAFSLELRKTPKAEIDRKVREAAEILEITQYLDRKPAALSGGQRQRVAIGRAMVRDPKVFLMDEPLSNLDAKLRNQMRAEIIKLRQRINTTFIYVTHDQTEAMTLGDRIVIMKDGYVNQIGTPVEVFNKPVNLFVAGFIGMPVMNFFDNCKLLLENGVYYAEIRGVKFKLKDHPDRPIDAWCNTTTVVTPKRSEVLGADAEGRQAPVHGAVRHPRHAEQAVSPGREGQIERPGKDGPVEVERGIESGFKSLDAEIDAAGPFCSGRRLQAQGSGLVGLRQKRLPAAVPDLLDAGRRVQPGSKAERAGAGDEQDVEGLASADAGAQDGAEVRDADVLLPVCPDPGIQTGPECLSRLQRIGAQGFLQNAADRAQLFMGHARCEDAGAPDRLRPAAAVRQGDRQGVGKHLLGRVAEVLLGQGLKQGGLVRIGKRRLVQEAADYCGVAAGFFQIGVIIGEGGAFLRQCLGAGAKSGSVARGRLGRQGRALDPGLRRRALAENFGLRLIGGL